MTYVIAGTDHRDNVLEYILREDHSLNLLEQLMASMGLVYLQTHQEVRDDVFSSLMGSFLQDYSGFVFCNSPRAVVEGARSLVIVDPIKRNLAATVLVEETLYPGFKKLKIVSDQMNNPETLYGGLVRDYIDLRVRETLLSMESVPEAFE